VCEIDHRAKHNTLSTKTLEVQNQQNPGYVTPRENAWEATKDAKEWMGSSEGLKD
jgi:hypothetical protein